MTGCTPVHNPAQLGVGDIVLTPSNRHAEVRGHRAGRVCIVYVDAQGRTNTFDGCDLPATCLRLVRKVAPAAPPPRAFFQGADAVRAGR